MDEGEGDGAEPFDLYDYVLVFADAAGVALIAGEGSAGYAQQISDLEFIFAVYFAAEGVVAREQAEEPHLVGRDGLYVASALVAVDPEWREVGGFGATFLFCLFCRFRCGVDEEELGYYRFSECGAVLTSDALYWQVGLHPSLGKPFRNL